MNFESKGWVYVITTDTHKLVKIGYTDRDPKIRASELDDTSSPHPHVVRYAALVKNPKKVEKEVHKELAEYREGKEWFNIDVESAIGVIRSLASPNALYEEFSGLQDERDQLSEYRSIDEDKLRSDRKTNLNRPAPKVNPMERDKKFRREMAEIWKGMEEQGLTKHKTNKISWNPFRKK